MTKFINLNHPLWIGQEEKSFPATGASPYDLPKASRLLSIGDESSGIDKIVRAVADNIVHHAVAYDISSGFMRDAPIPRTALWATEEITQRLVELKAYEAENAESRYQAKVLRKERGSLALMPPESWDMSNSQAKRAGYPPEIAAEALLKLLEHDGWPRNAVAAIGREAGIRLFITECGKLGIDARELTVDNWNRDMEREGRIPIGRTDMLFDPKIREYYKERNERDACRDKTIVWVATSASARGLDVPGVFHLYVLHRLEKAREYITYCGRVARWPFSTLGEDIKDPGGLGTGVRRGVGKVVSLLLEDHAVPASGLEGSSVGDQVITNDGSDRANWSWLEEGLMVAKIGCHFRDYYAKAGEYPCGPEVRMPEPIRPKAPPPTPSRPFELFDAALGSSPLQEPSFSHLWKESSSNQIPRDLLESPLEQPKQASEKIQPEPSTDLLDMWSLPFPDGSSKPAEELQQQTRSPHDDGDEANLWSALKDPAPPPQTPDFSLFRSPQEDFRADRRHVQEGEAGKSPTRVNYVDGGYWEPPTRYSRDQGRDPSKSKVPERVSAFDMDAVGKLNLNPKSPREEFRPDLRSDSERKQEAEMLSLKGVDAKEGYQEPPGKLKVLMHGFKRNRAGRPRKLNQNLEDFGGTLVPFSEPREEPPGSEKEARKASEEEREPSEEKKASKGEKRTKKKKTTKPAKANAGTEKSKKPKKPKKPKKVARGAPKQRLSSAEEAIDVLNDLLEDGGMGQIQDTEAEDEAG
ncbi:unnamed protein product [Tuber aestivum]|uniref:Helicase C-terminal domain-containing protein n=1 Tax=Tuber aestivum TaxID=59557 RepID=A0A292PM54_9PEZI|nr:unnamed protein product [Tuber aestivum]